MTDATALKPADDLPCGGCIGPCPYDHEDWEMDDCEHCSQPIRAELHPTCKASLDAHAADVAERRARGEVDY